jgi:hypothetical protein
LYLLADVIGDMLIATGVKGKIVTGARVMTKAEAEDMTGVRGMTMTMIMTGTEDVMKEDKPCASRKVNASTGTCFTVPINISPIFVERINRYEKETFLYPLSIPSYADRIHCGLFIDTQTRKQGRSDSENHDDDDDDRKARD